MKIFLIEIPDTEQRKVLETKTNVYVNFAIETGRE